MSVSEFCVCVCVYVCACVHPQSLQPCLTLWDPCTVTPPGSSVHEIFPARVLEWVTMPSSWDLPDLKFESMSHELQVNFLPLRGCSCEQWMVLGCLASGGEEFNSGPESRLDHSELLCSTVLLKYQRDRESFLHRHQQGTERVTLASL